MKVKGTALEEIKSAMDKLIVQDKPFTAYDVRDMLKDKEVDIRAVSKSLRYFFASMMPIHPGWKITKVHLWDTKVNIFHPARYSATEFTDEITKQLQGKYFLPLLVKEQQDKIDALEKQLKELQKPVDTEGRQPILVADARGIHDSDGGVWVKFQGKKSIPLVTDGEGRLRVPAKHCEGIHKQYNLFFTDRGLFATKA